MVRRFLLLRNLQIVLLIAGILALGYAGASYIVGTVYQRHALQQFQAKPAAQRSEATVPTSSGPLRSVVAGSAFARLTIARLGLSVAVIEGDTDRDLLLGAGHIPHTALPGNPGNVGIAAHRDRYFRPLRNIRKGDTIAISTPENTYTYEVDSTEIVAPTQNEVLQPTAQPSLTLVTCYPFYYVGSAPKRFIVRAHQVSANPPNFVRTSF